MHEVSGSKVYRLFYPSVPVIVAARSEESVSGMAVVSIISVSNEPPRVAFSSSRSHHTYELVARSRSFSVSWLDSRFVNNVQSLGTSSGAGIPDKLRSAGLSHTAGKVLDVPVINGAAAVLECSVAEIRPLGDHDLIVGDVRAARAEEDFREYWTLEGYHPILYAGMAEGLFSVYRG
jgi:flavin reductase (DIM6/NTAB) family NADH-FMN oxidoreductase RutF